MKVGQRDKKRDNFVHLRVKESSQILIGFLNQGRINPRETHVCSRERERQRERQRETERDRERSAKERLREEAESKSTHKVVGAD